MTIKSQIEYECPGCRREWLPHAKGLACPWCGRPLPDGEETGILAEALESARFNMRLYGRFELEFWIARRLGDRYLEWGFKALQAALGRPDLPARAAALAALMDIDLEEMTPLREHVLDFLAALIEQYRQASARNPADWQKMPEPEKPFFGRKIIDDA